MRLHDLIEDKLDEVSMSPGALQDYAKTPFAKSMTAGFEAELIIPDVKSDEDEYESEPDYDQDERIYSTQDILDFFVGDYNSRRTVERAIDDMNESFFEDADEAFADLRAQRAQRPLALALVLDEEDIGAVQRRGGLHGQIVRIAGADPDQQQLARRDRAFSEPPP